MDLLRLLNDGGVNGDVNGGVKLDELLFDAIKNNPGLNAPALSEILQKSLRSTQRYLKTLSDSGVIEFRGAAKNGGYYIIGSKQ
ncbi:MAG: winged helix-turn-helix domain-containing protein [Paludibacteraceae bacterium]|nr:winged helix-turn-helix domain-containing protein [Paludibacteraceae bacterium]